jgi:outer membrane protein assembly factor BamB
VGSFGLRRLVGLGAASLVVIVAVPTSSAVTTFVNWSAYLHGQGHSSYQPAATAITPGDAATLTRKWSWTPDPATMSGQPGPRIFSSPIVSNGFIYIGADTGVFYSLDEATGAVRWTRFLGYVTTKTLPGRGFSSTATVANDPVSGKSTVYVAAPDGYLYAMDAATGKTVWRGAVAVPSQTVNDYYNWSSPVVSGGHVYVGISSQGDKPLVRGGAVGFDQHTGAKIGTYYTMPAGTLGGSIWSSPAAEGAGAYVYVTTGNPGTRYTSTPGDSNGIVRLAGANLSRQDAWTVPASQQIFDSDFGASPTLFSALLPGATTRTTMIAACNKNGELYALRRLDLHAGPVWSFRIGNPDTVGPGICLSAAVFDGTRLYMAGNGTSIAGTAYPGSIRALDPATGKALWQRGLASSVYGSPSEDGSGVLAVATWDTSGAGNRVYLINAANGSVIGTLSTGNSVTFAQPVFADHYLFIATVGHGLIAYAPG